MNAPESGQPEFQDPLENFEPRQYDDPLEEALLEQTVEAIRTRPVATVAPETTVGQALEQMDRLNVACLVVAEQDVLRGVFTERDVLDQVAWRYEEVRERPVEDVMSRNPVAVYETDPPAAALCVMASSGYRHVPVLDIEDHVVGIVSPHRVTGFLEQHFAAD